jgi:hypothetical protein
MLVPGGGSPDRLNDVDICIEQTLADTGVRPLLNHVKQLWRLTATSKSGLTDFPSRCLQPSACPAAKGGPAGTAGGTQR